MVHQFARKEIADARDRVEGGNYDAAALFVRNAKADIEDYSKIDYGPWKEKFDQLHDDFQEEAEKGTNWDQPDPDKEILIELLDEINYVMDGMEPLRDEFSEHYELTGLPGDFEIEFTDEDVPEDRQATCIRCHRKSLEIIDTTVFMLEDLPGHRFICGKCFFELDVVAREEVE